MSIYTDRAAAVGRDTGWDVEDYAVDHEWSAVGLGPVGQHRDSDPLARSNFEVISSEMRERFGDAMTVVSFGHWGVGWVEEIAFDASREDIVDYVESWEVALSDYPVADDEHFSELEWNDNHPSDSECYSDDPHCGCDAAAARRRENDDVNPSGIDY